MVSALFQIERLWFFIFAWAVVVMAFGLRTNAQEVQPPVTRPVEVAPPKRILVELFDGTRVVGLPKVDHLKFDLGFDELEVPFRCLRKAEWKSKQHRFAIELHNRDRFSGTLLTGEIEMKAIFGEVVLDATNLVSVHVIGQGLRNRLPESEGLVAFYDFDNVANSRVLNRVGELHPINLGDTKVKKRDGEGGSLSFSGDSWIQVPHHQEFCQPQMTFSAWMKPTGTNSQRGSYRFIIGKTNDGGSWNRGYGFVYMTNDPEHIHFYVNGYSSSVVKAKVPSGKWAHLTGDCDSKTAKLFLNGKLVETVKISGEKFVHSSQPLMIGGDSGGYRWNGELDDIAVYNRALADDEVLRLFEDLSRNEPTSGVVDDPFLK